MNKKIYIMDTFWDINYVKNNKDCLFIFGDNDIKKGMKGQAIIRNEKNAYGIPTKKIPSFANNAYYTDDEYENNINNINNAIYIIIKKFMNKKYTTLVLSKDGLGTGLSKLPIKAPKTYEYLTTKINSLILLFT